MYNPKDVFEQPENYVQFLISKDFEGQYFDRKEIVKPYNKNKFDDVKKGLKECISAFANYNQDGGLIVIGINDKTCEPTGTDHLTEEQINNLFSILQNDIRNHATKNKVLRMKNFDNQDVTIYLLYTSYTENAICETNESLAKGWKRAGKQNLLLSETDRQQILRDKRVLDWEKTVSQEEFEQEAIDQKVLQDFRISFLESRNAEGIYSDKEVLLLAKAIKKVQELFYWTNAGLLFFEKNPQGIFAQSKIRLLRYDALIEENIEIGETDFDKTFYGSLPSIIRQIRKFVREGAYFKSYVLRKEGILTHLNEYPIEVIDELIVNAVIHRDYALHNNILCKLYKNAFVVENSGRILQAQIQVPKQFNLENFELEHYARNPTLVDWFLLLRDENGKSFVRALHEGTQRIKTILKEQNYPSVEYFSNGFTKVVLRKK